jgi:hypothetical protein
MKTCSIQSTAFIVLAMMNSALAGVLWFAARALVIAHEHLEGARKLPMGVYFIVRSSWWPWVLVAAALVGLVLAIRQQPGQPLLYPGIILLLDTAGLALTLACWVSVAQFYVIVD